jgi:poly(hydroxyalkanoate) depolymerase family esterase
VLLALTCGVTAGAHAEGLLSPPWAAVQCRLHLPAQRVSGRAPLIVALHGCKQDAKLFARITRFDAWADAHGYAVLYPEQSVLNNSDHCWNWFLPLNQIRGSGEPAAIVALTEMAVQAYDLDRAHVFVTGISSGGAMADILASCYPEVFAAVAIHSGLEYQASTSIFTANSVLQTGGEISGEESARRALLCSAGLVHGPVRAMLLQGTSDVRVYPVAADKLWKQFTALGDWLDDGLRNRSFPHSPTRSLWVHPQALGAYPYLVDDVEFGGKVVIRRITVQGLAHAWSGGPAGFANSDPLGPDATGMIGEFFDFARGERPL